MAGRGGEMGDVKKTKKEYRGTRWDRKKDKTSAGEGGGQRFQSLWHDYRDAGLGGLGEPGKWETYIRRAK